MMRKLLCLTLMLAAQQGLANEPILKIEATITGNQEQPKVFSIVPWEDIPEASYIGREIEFELTEDSFEPIDRDSFKLEVEYIQAIHEN